MREQAGEKPLRREGYRDGTWVLLDYGCICVHVFNAEARSFYDLERLWADGKPLDLTGVLTQDWDCARRRVSERNRRKAALSAEITQEGETGEAPPVADEASLLRGRLPFSGRLAPGKRLGRQRISLPLKS